MIKYKLLGLIAFLFSFGMVQAQVTSSLASNEPEKGTIMLSVNFGVGPYISQGAPLPNRATYSLSAPISNWFDSKPILNLEGRWFATSRWTIKLTGGFAYNYNPGYSELPGTVKEGQAEITDLSDLPTYKAVPKSENIQFSVGTGADHYWKLTTDLYFRLGGEFVFAYGRASANADSEEYVGRAIGEAYSFRPALLTGFDYFIGKSIFTGIEVRPIAYQYAVYNIHPRVGMGLLSSDSHSFLFLAQPSIKFGIRF